LDGIEFHHFGGTCYASNCHFNALLAHLGYDVTLCGADMRTPDVHAVSIVKIEGREFLVDVGYGGPFLKPLPRDLSEDYVIVRGDDRYVLSPQDAAGKSRLTYVRDGQPKHGYIVKPQPKTIADFAPAISASYRPEATFMNAVLIVTFTPDGSRELHNFTSTETTGGQTITRTLHNRAEIAEEAARLFGMPREIVLDALTEIPAFKDAWE
jgi:N-hydroxyarylamine O-acetyltransferase